MAREAQKARTRKDLLRAAATLIRQGLSPTLDEVAEAAGVSRATAYRYFPGTDSLLVEAALDVSVPSEEILLSQSAPAELGARLAFITDAFAAMIRANEAPLRTMMIHALQHSLRSGDGLQIRQNRRSPVIEAAIAGADGSLAPEAAERLAKALALVIGTEAMLVFRDVLRLDDAEAREVQQWAVAAMVAAARQPETIPPATE